MMQIRNGDTVLVRVKVEDQHGPMLGSTFLCKDVLGDECEFKRSDIVSVEPRALQVGDRVVRKYYDSSLSGEIIAVWNDRKAWVQFGEDTPLTWDVSELRPAP